jgi:hypothetical protein
VQPDGSPLPATEWTLILFVTELSRSLKASSIKVYLSGVRSLHVENGFDNPLTNCLRLEQVLRGIKRLQGTEGRPRRPITVQVLRRFQSILNQNSYRDAMFWAASCVGFFGFLRSGEFTTNGKYDPKIHLSLADVSVDQRTNPRVLLLHIKASKTDQFRVGHTVRMGATDSSVCAVRATVQYLRVRGGIPGPLFVHENGEPLSRKQLVTWIHDAVARLGLEGNYSGHSFRIGAATTAASAGVPDHLIKTMGRWLSDAYQIYIRTPVTLIDGVAARLVSVLIPGQKNRSLARANTRSVPRCPISSWSSWYTNRLY